MMFKKAQQRAVILGLLFPLATQALSCRGLSEDDASIAACDLSFSRLPTFANFCVGTIVQGLYTITNNTPATLKINYIRIQNNDTAPNAASSIISAPINNCSTSLAAGASCNILVKLQSLVLGRYNRVLQVGINTRQIEVDAPAITSSVNCIPTPPSPIPPPGPTPPNPVPGPGALYTETIIANAGVTNTGNSVVNGNLDAFPTTSVTGFPPGIVTGTINANGGEPLALAQLYYTASTAPALACQHNLTGQNLGGKTLAPGVYCFNTSAQLTGALTLAGTPSSSYTFQIGSTLTTASNSSVILTGGVRNDNITWAVGSSATLGTGTVFHGIIDAVTSISLNTGASLAGRAWALNGAVTLQNNAVNPNS